MTTIFWPLPPSPGLRIHTRSLRRRGAGRAGRVTAAAGACPPRAHRHAPGSLAGAEGLCESVHFGAAAARSIRGARGRGLAPVPPNSPPLPVRRPKCKGQRAELLFAQAVGAGVAAQRLHLLVLAADGLKVAKEVDEERPPARRQPRHPGVRNPLALAEIGGAAVTSRPEGPRSRGGAHQGLAEEEVDGWGQRRRFLPSPPAFPQKPPRNAAHKAMVWPVRRRSGRSGTLCAQFTSCTPARPGAVSAPLQRRYGRHDAAAGQRTDPRNPFSSL